MALQLKEKKKGNWMTACQKVVKSTWYEISGYSLYICVMTALNTWFWE